MVDIDSYDSGYMAGWTDGRDDIKDKICKQIDKIVLVDESNIDLAIALRNVLDLVKED